MRRTNNKNDDVNDCDGNDNGNVGDSDGNSSTSNHYSWDKMEFQTAKLR